MWYSVTTYSETCQRDIIFQKAFPGPADSSENFCREYRE
jgi:hypothetical protein